VGNFKRKYSLSWLSEWLQQHQCTNAIELSNTAAGKIFIQTIHPLDISASAVRQQIKNNEPLDEKLDVNVIQYIQEHHLYH